MSLPPESVSSKTTAGDSSLPSDELSMIQLAEQMTELMHAAGEPKLFDGNTKEDHRRVATATLKVLSQMGYTVAHPEHERAQQNAAIKSGLEELKRNRKD